MASIVGGLLGDIRGVFNKAPVSFSSQRPSTGGGFFGQKNHLERYMAQYGAVGTLFAVVSHIASATAQVDWHLYRTAASGKKEDREVVQRHAALDLWNRPNPHYTRQEFVESLQQHLDLTGESWWLPYRDERMPSLGPLELWLARPDRMEVVPSVESFIAGYFYNGPDGEKTPLLQNEVVQLRMPNPLDPYRGLGPVQSVLVDLDSARYSAEWNRNFFLNGAEPGGIIEVDQRLGDDEFNEIRHRWEETHRGVANAHRVAVLEHGKWKSLNFSQKDMQFTELRNVSRDQIEGAFVVTPFDMGRIQDVNRATAMASDTRWAKRVIRPRLERIKQALNHDILPMFGTSGQGMEFDYDDPTPPDHESINAERDSQTIGAKNLVDAGYDPDDVATAMGLPQMRYRGKPQAQGANNGQA